MKLVSLRQRLTGPVAHRVDPAAHSVAHRVGPALALALCLASSGVISPALAAGPDFSWNADLAAGKTIYVYGIDGHITASRSHSRQASVTAVKLGRDSNFDRVRIEATPSTEGVTVCALYPLKHGGQATCQPGHYHSDGEMEDVKVQVDFTIQVPDGVNLEVGNVNGGIDAVDLASDLEVRTVNGSIHATSSGLVEAERSTARSLPPWAREHGIAWCASRR